jgi:hypothetical protein
MADPAPTVKRKVRKGAIGGAVGGGIAAVAVLVTLFVPLIPVSYQQEYKEMETRQESYVDIERRSEQYTDIERRQQPYQTIETRNEELLSFSDTTIEGGESVVQSVYIPRDRSIELRMSASDTLRTYVTSRSDYQANDNQYSSPIAEQSNVRYGFTAPISDTYYIAFYNQHDGFFGLGAKNVGLYSATLTATWDESVTKYRTENVPVTKYRDVDVPVTKYKDVQVEVTKYREATKNITVIEMVLPK